ncbi:MAG TPA: hypothetical protein VHV80_10895 [Steroidobacteraceae bacterium]|jgi:hypothetical protein|nr:hypothetical protein [Steroidobacteraceae bacterium]
MTIRTTQSLSRALPIAAAALFVQIGSAVAASPQGDIQEQIRKVLSGSIATHTIRPSESRSTNVVASDPDAQEFARQLLLGWSVSHAGHAKAPKQNLRAEVVESGQTPRAEESFQSSVRQSLLGEGASSRGAL